MIDGIPDQVHQRVADLLDHRLVEFGLGAADDEFDVLAELTGDIPDHAMETVEGVADLHHAQLQGAVANALD